MTRRELIQSLLAIGVSRALSGSGANANTIILLLDEQCVATSEGIGFHLNSAEKHPENPVLLPGTPDQWDSLQVTWPATVLYSARDRRFRCWYSGLDVLQKDREAGWPVGYAESPDGIHWRKPDLGQVTQDGHPTNRLRPWMIDGYIPVEVSSVFENPLPDAPSSRRFGGAWREKRMISGPPPNSRLRLAWSPDGIHWTPADPPFEKHSDAYQHLFRPGADDPENRFIAFIQVKNLPRSWDRRDDVRHIGAMRGPSIDKTKNPGDGVLLAPEEGIDEELHGAAVARVGNTFLMLFESDRFAKNPIHGDLRLAVSTDGRHFRRVHPRDAMVRTGAKGVWDENLLVTTTAAMQEVGDTVYIFYIGCPNVFNSWPAEYATKPERRASLLYPTYLGLATLPRDRYGYAAGPGTLTTHPIEIAGAVWMNADGDALDVAALDDSGKQLARGRLGRETLQTVYRKLVWRDAPPRGNVQLRVRLSDGDKLYSIRCPEVD